MENVKTTQFMDELGQWISTHFTVFLIMGTMVALFAGMMISSSLDKTQSKPNITPLIVKGKPAPKENNLVKPTVILPKQQQVVKPKPVEQQIELPPVVEAPKQKEESLLEIIRQPPRKVETYTVQPGDTLTRIAKKKYRDTRKWTRIAKANKDKLKDFRYLKIGQVLVIPPDDLGAALHVADNVLTQPVAEKPSGKYTVKKGDTWWSLTKKLLGNPTEWKNLKSKNIDVLRGGALRPGMVLEY